MDTAFVADHYIPFSKGGGHNIENLKAAHKICNLRRGNGENKGSIASAKAAKARKKARKDAGIDRVMSWLDSDEYE